MKNTESNGVYVRYSVVLKHFQGLSNKYIGKMECLEEHNVGNYIKTYKNKGLRRSYYE